MADDFDQTQAIFLDEFDQQTDEEIDPENKTPVAHLKVSCQRGFPEQVFSLYEGSNVIGRHEESCNVCIPLKALSREHACIEIKGDSFLIYDKNSRNKTKRNKLYLSPDVRYELKHGDTLTFGDVVAKFTMANQDDGGSETGSESEFQTANDKDVTLDLEEEEYDSDNSVDLLQPTQAYPNHNQRNAVGKSLLADDSIVEKETTVLVTETPAPKRQKITTGPVIEESGSETEDEDAVKNPQTLVMGEEAPETVDPAMMYAQTQAYSGDGYEGDETDNEERILAEPTQAFPDLSSIQKDEPTQTFVAESESEDEGSKKKAFQYAATQAYFGEDVIESTQEQAQDKSDTAGETDEEDVSHLFTSSTLACDIDDMPIDKQAIDETVDFDSATQAVLEESTQVVQEDDEEEASTQVFPEGVATQPAPDDQDSTQVIQEVKISSKKAVQNDATVAVGDTLAFQNEATVAVVPEDATLAVNQEDATVAVPVEDGTLAVNQEDATVAVPVDDATMAVPVEDATMAVHVDAAVAVEEDPTLAIQNEATVAVTTDDATMAVNEDATMAIEPDEENVPEIKNETVAVPVDATVAIHDAETLPPQDNAPLVIQEEPVDVPKKGRGRGRQKKGTEQSETGSKPRGRQPKKVVNLPAVDHSVSSSQDSDDGNVRRSSRAKRKSFRVVEMEESLGDMMGIDESIKKGEDYSPERSDSESDSPKREKRGRKPKGAKSEETTEPSKQVVNQTKKTPTLPQTNGDDPPKTEPMISPQPSTDQTTIQGTSNVPPLPKEVVKKTDAEYLLTLPALQGSNTVSPVIEDATQAYSLEEDIPQPDVEEPTQAYSLMEEDTTVPVDGGEDERDKTPTIEEVLAATQAYSLEEEIVEDSEELLPKPALVSIPSRSPLKPALRSPEKRKKSPSPKRVQFTVKKTPSSSTTGSEGSEMAAKDNEDAAKSPTTSKIKEAIIKKVNNKRKIEATKDESKETKVVRGTRGKVEASKVEDKVDDEVEVETEVKKVEESVSVPRKGTRGRRSEVVEKEEEKPTATRGRGRKAASKEENVITEEKAENKKSTRKGRSRVSNVVKPGTSSIKEDEQIGDVDENEKSEENLTIVSTPEGDSQKSEGQKLEQGSKKAAGRKGRGAKKETETVEHDVDNTTEEENFTVASTPEEDEQKSEGQKLEQESAKATGRKGRSRKKEVEEKDESVDSGKLEQSSPTSSRRGRSADKNEIQDSEDSIVKEVANNKSKPIKSKGKKGKAVDQSVHKTESTISESESKPSTSDNVDSRETSKTTRRGRSSIVSRRDSGESEKDFIPSKPVGRKGKSSKIESTTNGKNITEHNESSEKPIGRRGRVSNVKIEEEPEKTEDVKTTGRRGRSTIVEKSIAEDSESDSQGSDTGSKKGKGKGQRSSSQPPGQSESQPVTSGRRGRSSIQPVVNNVKDEEVMPPPKTVGRRGKKTADSASSDTTTEIVNNKRTSRQSKIHEFADTNEVQNQEETSESKDSKTVESKTTRGRSSSRTRNIETIDSQIDNSSKSNRGKRKRDSSVDSINKSEDQPSTSKRTRTESGSKNETQISASNKKSRGRASTVKDVDEDSEDFMKTETRKRGLASDESSKSSPVKKAKLKEDPSTPKATKTTGVASPSLRRKSVDPTKPKVMFTGVIDEHGQKIIKDLGGEMVTSVEECTHLVTDKIRRTVKFLCCVARGIPIVTLQWIESCKQSAMFVDCNKFPVKDSATEKQYKFSLSRSIERAKEASLLQGYKVHVTKSVKPEPSQMAEIIKCAGGEYLTTMPKKGSDQTVVVSCSEDESLCTAAIKAGVPVVSSEFILTGILKQELSINSYLLFNGQSDLNTSTSSRRRR